MNTIISSTLEILSIKNIGHRNYHTMYTSDEMEKNLLNIGIEFRNKFKFHTNTNTNKMKKLFESYCSRCFSLSRSSKSFCNTCSIFSHSASLRCSRFICLLITDRLILLESVRIFHTYGISKISNQMKFLIYNIY